MQLEAKLARPGEMPLLRSSVCRQVGMILNEMIEEAEVKKYKKKLVEVSHND